MTLCHISIMEFGAHPSFYTFRPIPDWYELKYTELRTSELPIWQKSKNLSSWEFTLVHYRLIGFRGSSTFTRRCKIGFSSPWKADFSSPYLFSIYHGNPYNRLCFQSLKNSNLLCSLTTQHPSPPSPSATSNSLSWTLSANRRPMPVLPW